MSDLFLIDCSGVGCSGLCDGTNNEQEKPLRSWVCCGVPFAFAFLLVVGTVYLTNTDGLDNAILEGVVSEIDPDATNSYGNFIVRRLDGVSSNSSSCKDTSGSDLCSDKLGSLQYGTPPTPRYRGVGVYTFREGYVQRRDVTGHVYETSGPAYLQKPDDCFLYYLPREEDGTCFQFAKSSPWRFYPNQDIDRVYPGARVGEFGKIDVEKSGAPLSGKLGFHFETDTTFVFIYTYIGLYIYGFLGLSAVLCYCGVCYKRGSGSEYSGI